MRRDQTRIKTILSSNPSYKTVTVQQCNSTLEEEFRALWESRGGGSLNSRQAEPGPGSGQGNNSWGQENNSWGRSNVSSIQYNSVNWD